MINYTNYPTLKFLSYHKDNAPDVLPIEMVDDDAVLYIMNNHGFNEMFGLIAALNTVGHTPVNYYLNRKRFVMADRDDDFRNHHFRSFVSSLPKQLRYGSICSEALNCQHVYFYLPPYEAKLKSAPVGNGYICVATFQAGCFCGFEEAYIIPDSGYSYITKGFYVEPMEQGGLVSFATIALSFFQEDAKPVNSSLNETDQTIWTKP